MATLDLGALFGKLARVLERSPSAICRLPDGGILPTPKRQLFRVLRRARSPTSRPTSGTSGSSG